MAIVGIVCDTYKVQMFQRELDMAGIVYTIGPLSLDKPGYTLITCKDETIDKFELQAKVQPITEKVTRYYIKNYKKGK